MNSAERLHLAGFLAIALLVTASAALAADIDPASFRIEWGRPQESVDDGVVRGLCVDTVDGDGRVNRAILRLGDRRRAGRRARLVHGAHLAARPGLPCASGVLRCDRGRRRQ